MDIEHTGIPYLPCCWPNVLELTVRWTANVRTYWSDRFKAALKLSFSLGTSVCSSLEVLRLTWLDLTNGTVSWYYHWCGTSACLRMIRQLDDSSLVSETSCVSWWLRCSVWPTVTYNVLYRVFSYRHLKEMAQCRRTWKDCCLEPAIGQIT